jgi:hypothetical protein
LVLEITYKWLVVGQHHILFGLILAIVIFGHGGAGRKEQIVKA